MDIKHYSMLIQWSDEDHVYIITVPEIPVCRTHGEKYEEAVKRGQDAIESWIMVAKELGRPIPPPNKVAA
jgi:predicted RNase H-like HicB family nuclease